MQPNDNQAPQTPSGPPPEKLPRPQMQMINDIQGMQRPPRPMADVTPRAQAATAYHVAPTQPAPKVSHPNDHLLEAPHEKLLTEGGETPGGLGPKKKRSKLKIFLILLLTLIVLAIVAVVGTIWWYQEQLKPVDPSSNQRVRIIIEEGSSPSMIARELESEGVIRNHRAFSVYTKLSNAENNLKAGTYNLKKSASVQQIVDHLVSGKQDTFRLTFLPGDTLANSRKALKAVGYEEKDIDAAFTKTYERPLFASKPAGTDLEGYIFGDTYEFTSDATVEAILNRTFDEYEKYIAANNLVAGFKKQNLSLYQGITLASIVQREVTNKSPNTPNEDQRQVARVFLNRMKAGMNLGSDVTYQYAARKMGVDPTPTLQSPYNTRIHAGLPPGPIATPGVGAMIAVAQPGANDYLYFLSGDDDVTYFAKTEAEHQKNITNHCKKKCLIN